MNIDQYNDGPNVWLYDDTALPAMRKAAIPQPGRAGSCTRPNADEQALAATGQALCILTDGDFGGCELRIGTPDQDELSAYEPPVTGMLELPSGSLRVEGPNWLRCDPSNAKLPETESIHVAPGRYQVAVYRRDAEDEEDEELLIALIPAPQQAAGDFYLGYAPPPPAPASELSRQCFRGPLVVDGNDYFMRPNLAAREALGIRDGSLLRMQTEAGGITVALSSEFYVDPRLYTPQLVALRDQLDGLAMDNFGIRCSPDDPMILDEGTHPGELTPATLELDGKPVTHIPIIAGPDSWPDMLTIPANAAAPGDACARLEDLLRGCHEWVLGTVVWRDDQALFAEIAAFMPDTIQVSLCNTTRVGPNETFNRVPGDLITAFSWLIEQAAGCRTPLCRTMVRVVPRLPLDVAEVEAVSLAAWRELTANPAIPGCPE